MTSQHPPEGHPDHCSLCRQRGEQRIAKEAEQAGALAAEPPPPPGTGTLSFNGEGFSPGLRRLHISIDGSRLAVTFFPDGSVTFDPSYTPSDAARAFGQAIAAGNPLASEVARLRSVLDGSQRKANTCLSFVQGLTAISDAVVGASFYGSNEDAVFFLSRLLESHERLYVEKLGFWNYYEQVSRVGDRVLSRASICFRPWRADDRKRDDEPHADGRDRPACDNCGALVRPGEACGCACQHPLTRRIEIRDPASYVLAGWCSRCGSLDFGGVWRGKS